MIWAEILKFKKFPYSVNPNDLEAIETFAKPNMVPNPIKKEFLKNSFDILEVLFLIKNLLRMNIYVSLLSDLTLSGYLRIFAYQMMEYERYSQRF